MCNTYFYHASNLGSLKELLPLSTVRGSDEKVCFFTPVRAYALFYLRDMEINHVTCGVSDSGITIYHEQFPDQLTKIYRGRSGYLYVCKNNTNFAIMHTNGVWAATQPMIAEFVEYIDDVYIEILKAEESGYVQVIRYESLCEEKKLEINDMMKNYIIKNGLLTADTPKARFFAENFSQSWQEAKIGAS